VSLGDRRIPQVGEAEEQRPQHRREEVPRRRLREEPLGAAEEALRLVELLRRLEPDLDRPQEQLLPREVQRPGARRSRQPGLHTACRPADK
jgi:hypothetical protein